jgi:hypothetical protein
MCRFSKPRVHSRRRQDPISCFMMERRKRTVSETLRECTSLESTHRHQTPSQPNAAREFHEVFGEKSYFWHKPKSIDGTSTCLVQEGQMEKKTDHLLPSAQSPTCRQFWGSAHHHRNLASQQCASHPCALIALHNHQVLGNRALKHSGNQQHRIQNYTGQTDQVRVAHESTM